MTNRRFTRFNFHAASSRQKPGLVETAILILFPFVTITLFELFQDTLMALIIALVGAVTVVALRPSRAR